MKTSPEQTLFRLARDLGLNIKYTRELPSTVYGFLDVNVGSHRIVVNAAKPRCERLFTILHEVGHFLLICGKIARMDRFSPFPAGCRLLWSAKSQSIGRRVLRRKFNDEWLADLWAFCAFFQIGAKNDLQFFIQLHPEKQGMLFLAAGSMFYANIKQSCLAALQNIANN